MAGIDGYTEWFNNADTDGSGMVSLAELGEAMKGKGYNDAQVQAIFNEADASGDNKMSLEEFLVCMGACEPKVHRAASLTSMCRAFDKNRDGHIDRTELKAIIDEARTDCNKMTDEEADMLMAQVDADGNDQISYDELCERVFGVSCKGD